MFTTVIGSHPLKYDEMGKEAIIRSVRDQIDAGIQLASDGQTRYNMVEYFAKVIEGYSYESSSFITGRIGRGTPDIFLEDLDVAREITPHVKGIVTGPVTLVFSSEIKDYYKGYRDERVYLDTARAILDIARSLQDAGAEWIQIDEPFLSVGAPMEIARRAVESIALNLKVPVALHVCGKVTQIFRELLQWQGVSMLSHAFMGDDNREILNYGELWSSDKILGLGCVDTNSLEIEEVEDIERLIRVALKNIPKERLVAHPDCGLRGLPREIVLEKTKRLVRAAERVLHD